MHSRSPQKRADRFLEEFERTLANREGGVANFSGFVFPTANFSKRRFGVKCIFSQAVFACHADFSGARFEEPAIFSDAAFLQWANFLASTFFKECIFFRTEFAAGAVLMAAMFMRGSCFEGARFRQAADFGAATFRNDAVFKSAVFAQDALFNDVSPSMPEGVSTPAGHPLLATTFERRADFRGATFSERAEFRQTRFRDDSSGDPGPIFSSARFDKPGLVVFYGTDLRQALFHNCEVSEFRFENVEWPRRPNGKRFAFDEGVTLNPNDEATNPLLPGLGSADERNFVLVAELYQRLKKNYDARKDYWTAGDFHYGEMEMRRQATPPAGGVLRKLEKHKMTGAAELLRRVKRTWHRSLGLTALYKYASQYGESYVRPFLLLAFVVVLFGLSLPLLGLQSSWRNLAAPQITDLEAVPTSQVLTYWNSPHRLALVGHGLMAAVSIASFQRNLTYAPAYPWGRLLAILELLLTSTLVALFLLAVRRQFRR